MNLMLVCCMAVVLVLKLIVTFPRSINQLAKVSEGEDRQGPRVAGKAVSV